MTAWSITATFCFRWPELSNQEFTDERALLKIPWGGCCKTSLQTTGKSTCKHAVLCYDRTGALVSKKALKHDIYRAGVHPLGYGLIAMSRDCIVHAYDAHLEPILVTDLTRAPPEIRALRRRFEIPSDQLKNISAASHCHRMLRVILGGCGRFLDCLGGQTEVSPILQRTHSTQR